MWWKRSSYPKDSDIAFGPIGRQRELKWVKNVQKVVKDVARTLGSVVCYRGMQPGQGTCSDSRLARWA
jgi:hypothetical protein